MKFELISEVHSDILDIMEFYAESVGLQFATDFYAEFRRVAAQVSARPKSFPVHIKDYRRANLSRFPHNILFRVVDDTKVRILAVRHNHRDPTYGTDRT